MTSTKKTKNIFCSIIWPSAREHEKKLFDDFPFEIIHSLEFKVEEENSFNLLKCLYDKPESIILRKKNAVGNGYAKLIIFKTTNYKERFFFVNKNLLEGDESIIKWKLRLREILGNSNVHVTNSKLEARRDIFLLTKQDINDNDFLEKIKNVHDITKFSQPMHWHDLKEFFTGLNCISKYVVLRNFNELPAKLSGDHPDIDLLVEDADRIVAHLGAQKKHSHSLRYAYTVSIGSQTVDLDLREVGDGYMDTKWQTNILDNRVYTGCFYIPDQGNYIPSCIYHYLFHKQYLNKKSLSELKEYAKEILALSDDENFYGNTKEIKRFIIKFLEEHRYEVTIPKDPSVFSKERWCKGRFPIEIQFPVRELIERSSRIKNLSENRGYHFYSQCKILKGSTNLLLKQVELKSKTAEIHLVREQQFLKIMQPYKGFPRYIGSQRNGRFYSIVMEFIDGPLLNEIIADPSNYSSEDIIRMVQDLERFENLLAQLKIIHGDIHGDNIIVSNDGLILIDFGWARFEGEDTGPVPPKITDRDDEQFALLRTELIELLPKALKTRNKPIQTHS